MGEFEFYLYDQLAANAAPEIAGAYYRPGTGLKGMPDAVAVRLDMGYGGAQSVVVPLEDLSCKYLGEHVPGFVYQPRMKSDIDYYLMETTMENLKELDEGECEGFKRGYYLDRFGLEHLPDGKTIYVAGDRVIGCCGEPYVIAERVSQYHLTVSDSGSPEELARLLAQSPEQYLFAFLFVLLSCILSTVKELDLTFQGVLYLTGPQGKGKTTLSQIMSGWLREKKVDRPALFFEASSTDAATREAMTRFRDLPIVTDDLCRSASRMTERKRKEHGAMLVREGANAAKVIKKGKKGETVQLECVAGLILTAEFELENASDVTRCVFVPVERQMYTAPELCSHLVGAGVTGFLRCFCRDYELSCQILKEPVGLRIGEGLPPRARNNLDLLIRVFRVWARSLREQGVLEDTIEELSRKVYAAVRASAAKQTEVLKRLENRRMKGNIAYLIMGGLEAGAFSLADDDKVKKLQRHDGLFYKDDLCLRPEPLERFVRGQPGYGNWTLRKIVQELKDYGALVIQEEGTVQVYLKKDTPRVYRIRMGVLKKHIQEF